MERDDDVRGGNKGMKTFPHILEPSAGPVANAVGIAKGLPGWQGGQFAAGKAGFRGAERFQKGGFAVYGLRDGSQSAGSAESVVGRLGR